MGCHKPSAELAPGLPLGRAALRELLAAGLEPLVVTVREGDRQAWLYGGATEGNGGFVAVACRDADEGMSRSIRSGLREALRLAPDLDALLVALADQPMLTRGTVARYRETLLLERGLDCVAGTRDGALMPPVLWSRSMFGLLSELEGDQGGRSLLRREGLRRKLVPLDRDEALDIDTPADLEEIRIRWPFFYQNHINMS